MRLLVSLLLLVGVISQNCSCTPTRVVQKVWGDADVMFFGNITVAANGRIQAVVSIPLKGCLEANQKVSISTDGPCALKPTSGKTWLVTGMAVAGKIAVDSCGWTKEKSLVEPEDTLWLMNQFEKCPGRPVTCPNQRSPLNCDRSVCNLNDCSDAEKCETNFCHNCAVQYLNSDSKLKCGELGGAEYESKLCPTCAEDPCFNKTAADLAADCPQWQQAVKCLARPCSSCKEPIWVDADGRDVCSAKSKVMRCVDLGGVRFTGTCTASVLGYANMKNELCAPVKGCLPLPAGVTLYKTVEECRTSCLCEDFSKVNMGSASDATCKQDLGWGVVGTKCAMVKGCKSFLASPIAASLHPSEDACRASCGLKSPKGARPSDWDEEAQGENSPPQYSVVFPRNAVNRMDIKFDPAEFSKMEKDLQGIMNAYITKAKASGAMGRRLLQFGGGGGGGRRANNRRGGGGKNGNNGGGMDTSDLIRQILLQKLLGSNPSLAGMLGGGDSSSSSNPLLAMLNNQKSAAPAPTPKSGLDPATQRALDKMFAGSANPDGTCPAGCGNGGSCPPRRDVPKTVFGFNERGVILSSDPIFVRADVTFQNHTWHNVGIRYKGGNSLEGAYFLQSKMIGFRISASQYEKDYPETKNQKFFGFSKLTFSNNWMEKSHVREMLSYEILGASGIKTPRATPVRVYFDIGDGKGPVFWGLYTMIEDPSDVLVRTFPNDPTPGDGNTYKPENNTWNKFVAIDFDKKNNDKKNVSFADIEGAIAALNHPSRRTNPTLWRKNLEAVFDVPTFLKSLGTVSLIGNWDSYGAMPHNYYLYNVGGQLKWIPWDFNLALNCDQRVQSIFKNEIGDEWPLISFLMADPVYRRDYTSFIQWLITSGPFSVKDLVTRKNQLMALVTPHVMGLADPNNASLVYEPEAAPHTTMYDPASFTQESAKLENYIKQRADIAAYELRLELANQG